MKNVLVVILSARDQRPPKFGLQNDRQKYDRAAQRSAKYDPFLAGNMFIHYQECKRARLMSISKDLKEATNSIGKFLDSILVLERRESSWNISRINKIAQFVCN